MMFSKEAFVNLCYLLIFITFIIDLSSVDAKALEDDAKSVREMRKLLLTKDNIVEHLVRQQKKVLIENIPEPSIVRTSIGFSSTDGDPELRRGRSYTDKRGNLVVEGMRETDDVTDRISHRNGKYINNIFVPDSAQVPAETRISSHRRRSRRMTSGFTSRTLNPDFDEYYLADNKGIQDSIAMESLDIDGPRNEKPVYFVNDDSDNLLHGDRSPFSYEPADNMRDDLNQPSHEKYIIKEHTYEMCPGCPTFNIPVPTPQLQQPYKPQQQQAKQAQQQQQQQQQQHQQQQQQYYIEPREQQQQFSSEEQQQQQSYQYDQNQQQEYDQPQQFDQQLQQQFVHPQLQNHLDQYQQLYEQQQQQQQQQQPTNDERNFLERASQQLVATFKSFGENFFKSGKTGNGVETNRLAEKKGDVDGSSKQNFLPMMVAGAAAVALGGLALFGTQPSIATVNSAKNELVYQDRSGRSEKILESIAEANNIYEK